MVEYDYNRHEAIREIATLTEENAVFKFSDIVYADPSKRKNGFVDMKYNTMTNRETFSVDKWKAFKAKHNGVILKLPPEVLRYVKVQFAPNIQSLDAEEIDKQPNIKKLKKYRSRLQLSDHKGRIDINMCRNCGR